MGCSLVVDKMSSSNNSKISCSTVENSNEKISCLTKSIVSCSKSENVKKVSCSSPEKVANVLCLTKANVTSPNVELRNENMPCSIVENVLPTQSSPQLSCENSNCCRNGFVQSMSSSMLPFSPICVHSQNAVVSVENVEQTNSVVTNLATARGEQKKRRGKRVRPLPNPGELLPG